MSEKSKFPHGWANYSPHQKLAWRKENDTNTTGYVGVRETAKGRFTAKIFDPSIEKDAHLGTFDTAEEAGAAFDDAFIGIHGEQDEDEGDGSEHDPNGIDDLREYMGAWSHGGFAGYSDEQMEKFRADLLPLLLSDTETP